MRYRDDRGDPASELGQHLAIAAAAQVAGRLAILGLAVCVLLHLFVW